MKISGRTPSSFCILSSFWRPRLQMPSTSWALDQRRSWLREREHELPSSILLRMWATARLIKFIIIAIVAKQTERPTHPPSIYVLGAKTSWENISKWSKIHFTTFRLSWVSTETVALECKPKLQMLLGCHRAEGSVLRAQCREILQSSSAPAHPPSPLHLLHWGEAERRSAAGAKRKFDAQVAVAIIAPCHVR